MTTSTSDRRTSNTDDTIVEAGHSHGITTSAALYYPSLKGNYWDDELLPSGDSVAECFPEGICHLPLERALLALFCPVKRGKDSIVSEGDRNG